MIPKKKLIEVALPLEAINKASTREKSIRLAIVEFLDADSHRVHYLRRPFSREPDFGVTSVNYDLDEIIQRAGEPS